MQVLDLKFNLIQFDEFFDMRTIFDEIFKKKELIKSQHVIFSIQFDEFFDVRTIFNEIFKKNRQIATCNILTLQLQVLDLGFNLIRVIPTTAFKETKDLTLLALDGNPMAFIPEEAISHLNKSLRGLSLGGRFLTCDCKMRWITEWIQNFDLQVTSRERNPQFCGNPQHLRDRNFYQLNTRGTYIFVL